MYQTRKFRPQALLKSKKSPKGEKFLRLLILLNLFLVNINIFLPDALSNRFLLLYHWLIVTIFLGIIQLQHFCNRSKKSFHKTQGNAIAATIPWGSIAPDYLYATLTHIPHPNCHNRRFYWLLEVHKAILYTLPSYIN
jgi:hypothetical protein